MNHRRLRLTLYNWSRAAIGVLGLPLRWWRISLIVLAAAATGAVAYVHRSAQHAVVVEINGTPIRHRTNQTSPEGVLGEMDCERDTFVRVS